MVFLVKEDISESYIKPCCCRYLLIGVLQYKELRRLVGYSGGWEFNFVPLQTEVKSITFTNIHI